VSVKDLHLTGSNTPESPKLGDKLHIVAEVDSYNDEQCILFLIPVSTAIR
jgi:hypothetical protein